MKLIPVFVTLLFLLGSSILLRAWVCRTYPESFVIAVLSGFLITQVLSEVLSALHSFDPRSLAVAWAAILLSICVALFLSRPHIRLPGIRFTRGEKVSYAFVGALAGSTALTGFLVAPNNWDSLTYHLSRAAHWLQNQSVIFFPTPNPRENVMTPLPSLIMAQYMSAPEGFSVAFFGQWLSGVAVLVAVGIATTIITRDRRAVSIAVLVAATVPMLLSQMSTTQSDLLAGLPLAAGVVALRWLLQGREKSAFLVTAFAFAASLAIKPTAVILLVPIGLVMAAILMKRRQWLALAALIIMTFVTSVILNAPYLSRIFVGQGEVPSSAAAVLNDRFGFDVTALNALRSASSLISLPIAELNAVIEGFVRGVAGFFGWDPDLPEATFNAEFTLPLVWSEDHAAAPLHVILIVVALIALVLSRKRRHYSRSFILAALLVIQFLLLASAFRWQVWGNRFIFIVLVFASPIVAIVLVRARPAIRIGILGILGLAGILWVFLQPLRGLAGTEWIPEPLREGVGLPSYASPLTLSQIQQMFAYNPPSAISYSQAMSYAQSLQPDTIEVDITGDWWEYPIWLLNEQGANVKITHPESDDSAVEEVNPDNRIVRICLVSCDISELNDVRQFAPVFMADAPEPDGPSLTVGVVDRTN